jgi:hypothetical protein
VLATSLVSASGAVELMLDRCAIIACNVTHSHAASAIAHS